MADKLYEILEHTADIRIRIRAKDIPELFSRSAAAMFDIIAEKRPGKSAQRRELKVVQEAHSLDELFINWLNELLSLSSADEWIFTDFRIDHIDEGRVEAGVIAEAAGSYKINKEIKAATYHQLRIEKTGDGWKAEVIFDV